MGFPFPTVRDESAVTPHPTSLTLGHLPLKGKAGGCGGGIGLRAIDDRPYGEERSAYAVVGADIIRPWRSPCLPLTRVSEAQSR